MTSTIKTGFYHRPFFLTNKPTIILFAQGNPSKTTPLSENHFAKKPLAEMEVTAPPPGKLQKIFQKMGQKG